MEYQRLQPETGVQGDPAARELLWQAYQKTSRWGEDFKGFQADLTVNDNGVIYKGKVTIKPPREINVTLETPPGPGGEALSGWAQNQIGMMATHRLSRPFDQADGKYPITFADSNTSHPLGRQILINGDGMNSRYRIKDDRIRQISRSMERVKFTINVEEAMTTADGKFLTTQYVVYYFTPDGPLTRVESFTDRPCVVDGVYLPGDRRIIFNEAGEVTVRSLAFTHHQIL